MGDIGARIPDPTLDGWGWELPGSPLYSSSHCAHTEGVLKNHLLNAGITVSLHDQCHSTPQIAELWCSSPKSPHTSCVGWWSVVREAMVSTRAGTPNVQPCAGPAPLLICLPCTKFPVAIPTSSVGPDAEITLEASQDSTPPGAGLVPGTTSCRRVSPSPGCQDGPQLVEL